MEDKPWSDTPDPATLIYWDGLETDDVMRDYLRFSQDLLWLRRRFGALRGEASRVFHVHNGNRVIAFHRWLPGVGRDVVVVATLSESAWWSYRVGFRAGPLAGGVSTRRLRPLRQSAPRAMPGQSMRAGCLFMTCLPRPRSDPADGIRPCAREGRRLERLRRRCRGPAGFAGAAGGTLSSERQSGRLADCRASLVRLPPRVDLLITSNAGNERHEDRQILNSIAWVPPFAIPQHSVPERVAENQALA